MSAYEAHYDGPTIERLLTAVGKNVETSVTVSGIAFRQIVWEVAPTASNTVYGIAVHPTTGKLYRICSTNGAKTATVYSPQGLEVNMNTSTNTLELTHPT